MTSPKRPLKVFLCHAHADRDAVKALYTRLTKDGVDAWLDKEKLLPGQDWELEIRKAVREADVVVVCLSKQFNQAGFRQKEVRLALDTAMEKPEGEIFIIPARLEDCDAPEIVQRYHWVDLFDDNGYELLISALRLRADNIGVLLRRERNQSLKKTMTRKGNEQLFTSVSLKSRLAIDEVKQEGNRFLRIGKTNRSIFLFFGGAVIVVIMTVIIYLVLMQKPPVSTPIHTPQIIPTCVSPSLNSYLSSQPPNLVTNIFSNYKNDPIIYNNVRQDAFVQLGKSIKQWSDYEDVIIDGRLVRITITYLDPMLVQFVILNEALLLPNNSPSQSGFEEQIRAAMERLANRNEIMFIVTITSSSDYVLFVEIPITSMELITASGIRVLPVHTDPILSERNDVSRGSVHGFVGYPVSLSLPSGCTDVVNQWTTSLKLDHKGSLAHDHPFYPLLWNIPYRSKVIFQETSHPIPTIDPFTDIIRYNKSNNPPPPDMLTNYYSENVYWEEMGRYIWDKVLILLGY